MSETRVEILEDSVAAAICKLAGQENITVSGLDEGLRAVGVLQRGENLVTYKDETAWRRGGGETFVSDFLVEVKRGDTYFNRHVIAKAVVKHAPELTWNSWSRRIERLVEYSVPVPRTYSYHDGVIYQEYIPFGFQGFYSRSSHIGKMALLSRLNIIAKKIDKAGFHVTGLMHNLRTDGDDIYLIDFGEDLGRFEKDARSKKAQRNVRKWISKMIKKNRLFSKRFE